MLFGLSRWVSAALGWKDPTEKEVGEACFSGSAVRRRSFDGVVCHLSFALELKIKPL